MELEPKLHVHIYSYIRQVNEKKAMIPVTVITEYNTVEIFHNLPVASHDV